MGKKAKAKDEQQEALREIEEAKNTAEVFDPFVGGEKDDLMDMEYVQDETTESRVETHPPETKEEAEALAEQEKLNESEEKVEESREDGESAEDSAEEVDGEQPEATDGEEGTEEAEDVQAEAGDELPVDEDGISVPKGRFDEMNDRMKKAEERVKELEGQIENVVEQPTPEPEPEPFDYAGKNAAAVEAILEGDTGKYAEIQEEIRIATKDEALREAKKLAAEGDDRLAENITFEEVGSRIVAEYPQFAEQSENYNQAAYSEMMDLYEGYARSGRFTRIQAFEKAAQQAAKIHDLESTLAPVVEEETPDNVVEMKTPDVKKKVEASKKQPVKSEGGGVREEDTVASVNNMSDEDFEALPETTKRRMRGDIL